MADKTDKPDKYAEENENLVKALESIKSLLATSETKLSQARASISQASAHSLKMTKEVPMLEDVIIPGRPVDSEPVKTPEQHAAKATKQSSNRDAELQAFRAALEDEMKEKLYSYAAKLEKELKDRIQAFLDKPAR